MTEGRRGRRGPRWACVAQLSVSFREKGRGSQSNHDPIRPKIRRMRYHCRAPAGRRIEPSRPFRAVQPADAVPTAATRAEPAAAAAAAAAAAVRGCWAACPPPQTLCSALPSALCPLPSALLRVTYRVPVAAPSIAPPPAHHTTGPVCSTWPNDQRCKNTKPSHKAHPGALAWQP